ncbi:zinc-binding dehydrogenase [Anaerotruncus massiliensis (ex Togo et al. 2019)]|uniref:zinc-dependent alcohol dehydrogenase n=1 Tax=Anaerotruncus massiliensis (ex Togo et al. 2019) TaxID=1673720 RepID=UPI00208A17F1|nr:alcohol dehydrogenase catalytic domain-containing protein [Anaerotruncus massiliensis (ex Togo et al. 2019)]GKH46339.1 alcohol dehydrogenase [Oscillospiraceae bacterium]
MKSLRMRRNRELYFLGLPDPPEPGPDEVLVRMKYASICGFDMMMLNGKAAYPKNGVLGHEGSGIIEAVGKRVSPAEFKPGDRVAINPYTFCGQCDACRSNQPNFCINPGGRSDLMTEYISIDAKQAFLLPTEVSLPAGSLIEPLMMAMHAISKARLDWGKNLIILGGGAMGQIILKLARQYPLGKIVVVEPVAAKREMAKRFGADVVLDPSGCNLVTEALLLNGGMGYDAVIEASGSRGSAQTALNIVARGGSVVYFGLYGMDFNLEVNLFNLYWKDATISCVCVPSGYFPSAIAMAGRLRLEEVVTGLFPFSQGIQAFAEKASGAHAKVMLQFDEEG